MDHDDEAEVDVDAEIAAAAAAAAAAAVVADEAEIEENELKLTSLLKRKKELPLRTRNKLNGLVADLLTHTKDDIHDMLCDQNEENYQGLDSDRDTEAEVETALRFFPEVISLPTENRGDEYPIQRLCFFSNSKCNVKAVSFVSILARVAIESHSFGEHERGGLLIEGVRFGFASTLCQLVDSSPQGYGEEHDQLVDNLFLRLLVQLRQMGLLIKEDIQEHQLTHRLLKKVVFAENRRRFLIQWDPTSLTQTDLNVWLPLHYVSTDGTIREFQIVFEYGIRFYPNKKGITLLFQKDTDENTPFQMACTSYGRVKVMDVVNDILARYHSSDLPLNIVEALMMAAIDDDIHLDCVLFLMQREPDVIVKLLLGSINNNNTNANSIVAGESDGGGGGSGGSHDHDDDNDEDRKRKSRDDDVDNDVVDDDDNFNDGDSDIDNVNNTNNEVISRKRKRRG